MSTEQGKAQSIEHFFSGYMECSSLKNENCREMFEGILKIDTDWGTENRHTKRLKSVQPDKNKWCSIL